MACTNLDYLRAITDGNKQMIREMIELFLQQIPVFTENLNNLYQTGLFSALGKEAHKAKSSLQIMGMTELELEMKLFQRKTIEGIDQESYPVHIRNFEIQCKAAAIELQEEIDSLGT